MSLICRHLRAILGVNQFNAHDPTLAEFIKEQVQVQGDGELLIYRYARPLPCSLDFLMRHHLWRIEVHAKNGVRYCNCVVCRQSSPFTQTQQIGHLYGRRT